MIEYSTLEGAPTQRMRTYLNTSFRGQERTSARRSAMSLSGLNGFGRCARFGLQFGLLLWRAVRLPAASTLACPSSVRCLLPS